jgi:hypothetical protein
MNSIISQSSPTRVRQALPLPARMRSVCTPPPTHTYLVAYGVVFDGHGRLTLDAHWADLQTCVFKRGGPPHAPRTGARAWYVVDSILLRRHALSANPVAMEGAGRAIFGFAPPRPREGCGPRLPRDAGVEHTVQGVAVNMDVQICASSRHSWELPRDALNGSTTTLLYPMHR